MNRCSFASSLQMAPARRQASVTRDDNDFEVLVELDVVLPVLALGVIDLIDARRLVFLLHFSARTTPGLQGGLNLRSVSWRYLCIRQCCRAAHSHGEERRQDTLHILSPACNAKPPT